MINLIWAMDTNFLIGKDNLLPWRIPHDLKYFRETTNNKTVLMGDNTYYSLKGYFKNGVLPWPKIYVASLDKTLVLNDAEVINDLNHFLSNINEEIFIIGGREIYKLSLPYASKLYITHILNQYNGNVYFPKFDLGEWKVINKKYEDEVIFTIYQRK